MARILFTARSRLRRLNRRFPALPPILLIAVLVAFAWYVGIRAEDRPTNVHSLGFVAQVRGDRGSPGRNSPAGHCGACVNGTDVMRYNHNGGLRVDMVVSVHPQLLPWPHCGNATVDLVVSGTPKFWNEHNRLGSGVTTKLAVGWDRFTRIAPPALDVFNINPFQAAQDGPSPALVSFYNDAQAALHPGFFTDRDLADDLENSHPNRVHPFPRTQPIGLVTQIGGWGSSRYPLHLHFKANWLEARGFGSCYVLLPSLLANGAFAGTDGALEALVGRKNKVYYTDYHQIQTPSYGSTALAATGPLSLTDTSPTPTDFAAVFVGTHGSPDQRAREQVAESGGKLGPVWSCQPTEDLAYQADKAPNNVPPQGSFAGNACGAVAVVDAPGASDLRAVVLIVFGVLIALAFEWFFRRARAGRD